MQRPDISHTVILGYYSFRGKAQVLRLICQYLHLSYKNNFINPEQWSLIIHKKSKEPAIKDLPYLKDDDFIVCGSNAIVSYIVQLANRSDMLGQTIQDKIKVDSFRSKECMTSVLSLMIKNKKKDQYVSSKNLKKLLQQQLQQISSHLSSFEQQCCENSFYLGYISIVDFYVYEILNCLLEIVPLEQEQYPKLFHVRDSVARLEKIQNYEESRRAIVEYCPIRYFQKFKVELRKARNLMLNADLSDTQ